ncbi:MAG: ATP-binding cassette domain-containing protein [bacterium]
MSIEIATSLASTERVFEYLDISSEIDIEKTVNLPIKGKVEFKNVSFNYSKNSLKKVLENISFIGSAGKTIALVGYSGSGKSTLMDLISRFYDPDEGQILIDDVDIKKIKLSFLRQNIGVVMQQSILFSGTIEENIRLGNFDASFEEIKEASKQANAYDFIMNFEQGFNSIIGEHGKTLSMGQKQRISIARTFLKNPKILIFDEITSALDAESESLIQNAIQKLMKDRTTFIIAHRLSTIIEADIIIVMNKGKFVEKGTHKELLEKNEFYASLYNKQFKNVINKKL